MKIKFYKIKIFVWHEFYFFLINRAGLPDRIL